MINLAGDDVHLWTLALDDEAGAMVDCLSPTELHRMRQFARVVDARRYARVRSTLRHLLARYLDVSPRALVIETTSMGRPFLAASGTDGLNFNVSHSDRTAIIAIGCQPHIGVDVEDETTGRDLSDIVPMLFDDEDSEIFEALPLDSRPGIVLRCWTRKEAVAKAVGTGFLADPRSFRVPFRMDGIAHLAGPGDVPLAMADVSRAGLVAAVAADRLRKVPVLRSVEALLGADATRSLDIGVPT